MLCVVAPVLQVLPAAWLEVKMILSPWQNEDGPLAVITGGVVTAATTVTLSEDWHPFAFVVVSV